MEAKRAYIIPLNNPRDAMSTHRFSVYLDAGNGLEVLWPVSDLDKENLLRHQAYSRRRTYPAYHFALSGCGYSKEYEIASDLHLINPNIDVFELNGHSPSLVKAAVKIA